MQHASDDYSFFTAIGHSQAVYEAVHFGIYASEMKMITSQDGDIRIRVLTRPAVVNGKPNAKEKMTKTVYNRTIKVNRIMDGIPYNVKKEYVKEFKEYFEEQVERIISEYFE